MNLKTIITLALSEGAANLMVFSLGMVLAGVMTPLGVLAVLSTVIVR